MQKNINQFLNWLANTHSFTFGVMVAFITFTTGFAAAAYLYYCIYYSPTLLLLVPLLLSLRIIYLYHKGDWK